jgi:5-dehydro-4-deoxyglucarate dehydratase
LPAAAERAGADGLLLLPHYLTGGVVAHVEAVCKSTRLGVIFYHRDRARVNEELLERPLSPTPVMPD